MEKIANEIFRDLEGIADGAFVVDGKLRIHKWNNAAEEILGFSKGDVVGQFCYQILQGLNDDQQLICSAHCQVSKLAMKSRPVSSYDILACTKQGEKRWLNMSIITLNTVQNGSNKMIIHLFRDISQKKNDEVFFHQFLNTARSYINNTQEPEDGNGPYYQVEKLTRRQREVLTQLARGFNTQEIANNLFISSSTVRNHIQHILEKLQVHSRLEEVTLVLKNGMVD